MLMSVDAADSSAGRVFEDARTACCWNSNGGLVYGAVCTNGDRNLTEIGNGLEQGAVEFPCNTASLWSFSCKLGSSGMAFFVHYWFRYDSMTDTCWLFGY